MSSHQLRRAIAESPDFELISQNGTYTVALIKGIGDQVVYCRPGGDRAFMSLVFEHRGGRSSLLASLVLVPPSAEGEPEHLHEQRRRAALPLIDERKRGGYFISLINFNDLIRQHLAEGMRVVLRQVSAELFRLRQTGEPSLRPRVNNRVSSWTQLFSLLSADAPTAPPNAQAGEPQSEPQREPPRPVSPAEAPITLSRAQRGAELGPLRLERVLFLGAEVEDERGDLRSRDDVTQEALRGGARAHEPHFQLVKAQLSSLGDPRSVYFDDVSIVPCDGDPSGEARYRERVTLSLWYHRRLLNRYQPNLVVICGALAAREYLSQVLNPSEFEPTRPPVILQLCDVAQRGYLEPLDHGWRAASPAPSVYELLCDALRRSPGHPHYKLVAPEKKSSPWRVEVMSA